MLVEAVLLLAVFGLPCHRAEEAPQPSQSASKSNIVINEKDIRVAFRKWHNALRIRVANGAYLKEGPASNMYRLFPNYALEALAKQVLNQAAKIPSSYGSNYYTRKIPSGTRLSEEAIRAVHEWAVTTTTLYQMILAEVTQIGCAYKLSSVDGEDSAAALEMLCLYEKKYREGEQPYTKGPPCKEDSDCTTYKPSTCVKKYGVCDRNVIS